MPKTIRAEVLGFCPGVRRATELVEHALACGESVATLGPLIHNPQVVERFRARGVESLAEEDVNGTRTIVSRSHGIPQQTADKLKGTARRYVNGTCPKVIHIHRIAERAEKAGATLLVVGAASHPEVQGILSRCSRSFAIASCEDVAVVAVTGDVIVVAQTTFSREGFEAVADSIASRFPEAKIIDSICSEIDLRDESVKSLVGKVDSIVVVGGRNSSNTKRIFTVAQSTKRPCWHVEAASELSTDIAAYECVGIAAGASTPDWVIDEVEQAINEME